MDQGESEFRRVEKTGRSAAEGGQGEGDAGGVEFVSAAGVECVDAIRNEVDGDGALANVRIDHERTIALWKKMLCGSGLIEHYRYYCVGVDLSAGERDRTVYRFAKILDSRGEPTAKSAR